jgi:hypothetical protein
MIGARAQRRSERNVVAGLEQILVTVARPNPAVLLWRWRYEVILLIGAVLPVALLVRGVGTVAALALTAAVALSAGIGLAMSPRLRRLVSARAWCVITPHRVRTGCAQARIHSRQGRLPFVLRTSAAPHGERVWLWCRAGTSIEDFVAARPLLMAACWAADVRVTPSGRHAQLVILDVYRGELTAIAHPVEEPAPVLPDQPVEDRPRIPKPRQPAE